MNREREIKITDAVIGYTSGKTSNILLSDINLSAHKGENIALIGVNGSGKSTLLHTIAGSHKLLSGQIKIKGKLIENYSAIESAKKLSIVTSEIINTRFLKVFDLVKLGRFPHQSFSKKQSENDINIIQEALSITGILHLAEKNISEISDGERQKVMIARALAQNTDIILLDEPTAFLDIENKYTVYNILSETAAKQNKTIIFSTHDLNIALKHADKVWLIKDKTIYEGAPEDLILQNVFNNLFSTGNVYFDKNKVEFSVKFQNKYPIKLINNSSSETINKLTINALNRKGFFIDNTLNKITINITKKKQWVINSDKKDISCFSIYSLMKKLLEIIK
ncbi:MAG: ABC transporter ATP-binding protein [Bacteroidales bacterium]|nr:ABC transporter ATP-binding protein [Bacteroidales bacterium]